MSVEIRTWTLAFLKGDIEVIEKDPVLDLLERVVDAINAVVITDFGGIEAAEVLLREHGRLVETAPLPDTERRG